MVLSDSIITIINVVIEMLGTIQIFPGMSLLSAMMWLFYASITGAVVYRLMRPGDNF